MKKLLVAVLAFALFAPAFAVENVQITGDIQTIGVNLDGNHVATTKLRGTTNRVLLGLGADLVEDVHAQLTFAHRNIFGQDDVTGETVDAVWNNTFVAEAYVNISNVFDALEVKVGRQFYGDEKSAVMYFGPDYGYAAGNNYTSFDGVTAKYNGENLTLTAAYFALNKLAPLVYTDNEQKLGGLDLALKLTDELSANAYVYDLRTKANDSFGFWGVKPTFETDNLKAAVEYARNYGEHEKGWQVKADLALPLELDNWTLTPRATYLKSEKGFEAFGNYRPGLLFGTLIGGGINNLLVIPTAIDWDVLNIGACMKFASLEKFGFGLDFYTVRVNNHFTGNTWEAKVVYNHNEYVAFNLTGALLTNAGHSWNHSMTAVQLGMNIKF